MGLLLVSLFISFASLMLVRAELSSDTMEALAVIFGRFFDTDIKQFKDKDSRNTFVSRMREPEFTQEGGRACAVVVCDGDKVTELHLSALAPRIRTSFEWTSRRSEALAKLSMHLRKLDLAGGPMLAVGRALPSAAGMTFSSLSSCALPANAQLCCPSEDDPWAEKEVCAEALAQRTGARTCLPCCENAIKDVQEDGIDCGGTCHSPCESKCDNGIQDSGEIGVDCGPGCPDQTCCNNGIRDFTTLEEGIDCGSGCSPCRDLFCDNSICGYRTTTHCEKPACGTLSSACAVTPTIFTSGGFLIFGGTTCDLNEYSCKGRYYGWIGEVCYEMEDKAICTPGSTSCPSSKPSTEDCVAVSKPRTNSHLARCSLGCRKVETCVPGSIISKDVQELQGELCFNDYEQHGCPSGEVCDVSGHCITKPICGICETYDSEEKNCKSVCKGDNYPCESNKCGDRISTLCQDTLAGVTSPGVCSRYVSGKGECLTATTCGTVLSLPQSQCEDKEPMFECASSSCALPMNDPIAKAACQVNAPLSTFSSKNFCRRDASECEKDNGASGRCFPGGTCIDGEWQQLFARQATTDAVGRDTLAELFEFALDGVGVFAAGIYAKELPSQHINKVASEDVQKWTWLQFYFNAHRSTGLGGNNDRKKRDVAQTKTPIDLLAGRNLGGWELVQDLTMERVVVMPATTTMITMDREDETTTTLNDGMTETMSNNIPSNTATTSSDRSTISLSEEPVFNNNGMSDPKESNSSSTGIIVGVVIGVLLLLLGIVVCVVLTRRRNNNNNNINSQQIEEQDNLEAPKFDAPEQIYGSAAGILKANSSGVGEYGAAPQLDGPPPVGEYGVAPAFKDETTKRRKSEYAGAPTAAVNPVVYDTVPPTEN